MAPMKVTKKRCTTCESEGVLVNVLWHNGDSENALPASAAEMIDVAEASSPYLCRTCKGPGFYFYALSGEFFLLDELPGDVEVVDMEGTEEWRAHHEGQPANFIWSEEHYVTSN